MARVKKKVSAIPGNLPEPAFKIIKLPKKARLILQKHAENPTIKPLIGREYIKYHEAVSLYRTKILIRTPYQEYLKELLR